jgi:hypothetical protein
VPISVLKVGSYFKKKVLSFKFFFEARETTSKGPRRFEPFDEMGPLLWNSCFKTLLLYRALFCCIQDQISNHVWM